METKLVEFARMAQVFGYYSGTYGFSGTLWALSSWALGSLAESKLHHSARSYLTITSSPSLDSGADEQITRSTIDGASLLLPPRPSFLSAVSLAPVLPYMFLLLARPLRQLTERDS